MLASHKKTIVEALGRHPIHPFPARMAPGIALEALAESKAPLMVLDPMMGSGTVLAVAHASGHQAFGVDIDPLAVLLARVWTQRINRQEINEKAEEVLGRARRIFKFLTLSEAYPINSDEETRSFVRYWFDAYARRQLAALSIAIGRVRDQVLRDTLWCGFSRLIITKQAGASLAMDLSHSRPHKVFRSAPIKPFNKFISAVGTVSSNCPNENDLSCQHQAVVKEGDARRLDIPDDSIDLVLTSPPYLNAIDYMRCSKFSLVWMGYNVNEIRKIRAESVGAELSTGEADSAAWIKDVLKDLKLKPKLSSRHEALLSQYVLDMSRALGESYRVLRTGGRAVYVVGDSTIRGTFVRNSAAIEAVARHKGFMLESQQSRRLPGNRRYLPPPAVARSRVAMNARMRREVVMVFSK